MMVVIMIMVMVVAVAVAAAAVVVVVSIICAGLQYAAMLPLHVPASEVMQLFCDSTRCSALASKTKKLYFLCFWVWNKVPLQLAQVACNLPKPSPFY